MKFFGHILTKDGLKADPKKISAIKSLTAPSNKQELQSFLGLFNYLNKFLPTTLYTTEMRKNLQGGTNAVWTWNPIMEQEFNNIKKNLELLLPTLDYLTHHPTT